MLAGLRAKPRRTDQPERMSETANRILLLGLGNEVLTDDAIGLEAVRAAQSHFVGHQSVDVRETTEMGLALLDFIEGYRALILVDSIQTGRVPPGTIHEVDTETLSRLTGRTPHFLGVGETLVPLAECALFYVAFQRGRGLTARERWQDWVVIVMANLASFGLGEVVSWP